jgi:phosphoribosylamine--glycine ligase/phosphoribosylaminoimidazole synthetase
MNVLIVGGGGREHALAWKVAQSPLLDTLYVAPGNPGTLGLGENVALNVDDHAAVVAFCQSRQIDLAIIGPEAPLAAGIVDALAAGGIRCFGPSQAAAQIEASKAFAKAFMARHAIPSARYQTFTDVNAALAHLAAVDYPVVIKASGLAAGKGVILPETPEEAAAAVRSMLVEGVFGAAGREIVVEERLSGPEVSLMAFCDGRTVAPMIPAQDHKRLLDGDGGPNTGGMGAYAPAPVCGAALGEAVAASVLQPAVDGLAAAGAPFVGVLYAGLMLTADGPRVLEFNCRFGDPETQAVLPLLESDLLEVMLACTERSLDPATVRWRAGSAVCVVIASGGYPGELMLGHPVTGLSHLPDDAVCFHAGTRFDAQRRLVNAGGRVLGVTAWASTLGAAIDRAYQATAAIAFAGMQYRRDIAARALTEAPVQPAPNPAAHSAYAAAGVNIDAGNQAVALMKAAVHSTYTPAVLGSHGGFGGLFDAAPLQQMRQPVLVASTDGVGTKVKLAAAAGRYRGIGHDIVNHCIDDILVQGARPLFFMDYVASAALEPAMVAEIVTGMAEACRAAGCVLLGGETAEMPGVYAAGAFDVAGTIVGVAERAKLLPRTDLAAGDVLIGLASSGPHTNGFSLIRKIFADAPLDVMEPALGVTLADALLAPHRPYLNLLQPHLDQVKALAHLTGGGFYDNIPRVLPAHLAAVIDPTAWHVPPIFRLIQQRGQIADAEMMHVFNMGIGMVAMVDPAQVAAFQAAIPEKTWVLGRLVARTAGAPAVEIEGM